MKKRSLVRRLTIAAGVAAASATLVAGPAVAAPGGPATEQAGQQVSAELKVAWPFATCDRHNYATGGWLFIYDHTDYGYVNYYRVWAQNGDPVGSGWARCLE